MRGRGSKPDAATRPEDRGFLASAGLTSPLWREHPALLVTGGYALVSLIGMMFSWAFFRRFGLNYFDYAEVSDFLMAALREPMTFTLTAVGLIVAWLLWLLTRFEQRHFARKPPRRAFARWYAAQSRYIFERGWLFSVIMILYAYLFIGLYADWKVARIKASPPAPVQVIFSDSAGTAERVLLGTTHRMVFLYDRASQAIDVLPLESLLRLRVGPTGPASAPEPAAKPDPAPVQPPSGDPPGAPVASPGNTAPSTL